ncbi:MAG TPA: glycosyltransferase [Pyrinomonadaceae bacterium]|nr:glycosyltransferase [Pyrinomonadaceae bacterium]
MIDERAPLSAPAALNQESALAGRRVLFVSYNGMLDPLGQSQVLPYLRELARRGVQFTLLSFERSSALAGDGLARIEQLRAELLAQGIEWHWLRYHQTPSLPATMFDVMNGIRLARRLVRKNKIEMVHARSHIPATIALSLKKQFGIKMIFDVRGLMADEYVDANHWQKGSLPYRLTKSMERRAFAAADGIVTLTNVIWPIVRGWEGLRGRNDVAHAAIPCCADLELFKFSVADRQRRRQELGLTNQLVLVYSGSIDGWYLTEAMADFFAEALKRNPQTHALWLTPAKHDRIHSLMKGRGIETARYSVVAAASRDVPSYLSASDAGIAFIKPCFSKLASSPTKYAEYLACGLPLVINAGIGDSDSLISEEYAGVLIQEFNRKEYEEAAAIIEDYAQDAETNRALARGIAERLFDVKTVGVGRYAGLYCAVLESSRSS